MFVLADLLPVMITLLFLVINIFSFVNVAVHPWSASCPIDSRERFPICGNRWTLRAAGGKFVYGSSAVCVDFILVPSCSSMWIGVVVGCLFKTVAPKGM